MEAIFVDNTIFNDVNYTKEFLTKGEYDNCTFRNCNLSLGHFKNSILNKATFDKTNLEKVDFRTVIDFTFDLDNNKIKNTKFTKE